AVCLIASKSCSLLSARPKLSPPMNSPVSLVSARTTARINGIVAMTKTSPKTGSSSFSPRRSCLPSSSQLARMRAGTASGPRDGAVLRVRHLGVLLEHPLDEVRCGLLVLGCLGDPQHPVPHHAHAASAWTLRNRLEADLAGYRGPLPEHRGVDLARPGRGLE